MLASSCRIKRLKQHAEQYGSHMASGKLEASQHARALQTLLMPVCFSLAVRDTCNAGAAQHWRKW